MLQLELPSKSLPHFQNSAIPKTKLFKMRFSKEDLVFLEKTNLMRISIIALSFFIILYKSDKDMCNNNFCLLCLCKKHTHGSNTF